jgi:TonB family protein
MNRTFLWFAILFSIAFPTITFSLTPVEDARVLSVLLETAAIGSDTLNGVVAKETDFMQFIVLAYFAGMTFFLARFFVQIRQILKMIFENGISKYEGVNLVITENEIAPFSFFNLIFVNRKLMGEKSLNEIIHHEFMHIKQYHSVDIIMLELLSIIQWFNPVVWLYRGSFRLLHEYLADEGVLQKGYNSIDYQNLLLNQSTGLNLSGITNNFNHSLIKNRIIMMTRTKSGWAARLKVLIAAPVALLLAIALSIGMSDRATAQLVKEQNPAQEKQILETPKVLADEDDFFTVVDEMPRYPGGDEARMKFLMENIKYPEAARKAGKQGVVFVQFIVEPDGKITNAQVLRGFDAECDAMALKTIQSMPDWIPGKHQGKNVRVQFVLPIKFSLGNDSGEKK